LHKNHTQISFLTVLPLFQIQEVIRFDSINSNGAFKSATLYGNIEIDLSIFMFCTSFELIQKVFKYLKYIWWFYVFQYLYHMHWSFGEVKVICGNWSWSLSLLVIFCHHWFRNHVSLADTCGDNCKEILTIPVDRRETHARKRKYFYDHVLIQYIYYILSV
jgi:hypothetical protein